MLLRLWLTPEARGRAGPALEAGLRRQPVERLEGLRGELRRAGRERRGPHRRLSHAGRGLLVLLVEVEEGGGGDAAGAARGVVHHAVAHLRGAAAELGLRRGSLRRGRRGRSGRRRGLGPLRLGRRPLGLPVLREVHECALG